MLDCYWDHLAGIHDMCSVFRASEVVNTTNNEPRCISSVVLAEILTEIGNVFSSEFSCSGIVGDWS